MKMLLLAMMLFVQIANCDPGENWLLGGVGANNLHWDTSHHVEGTAAISADMIEEGWWTAFFIVLPNKDLSLGGDEGVIDFVVWVEDTNVNQVKLGFTDYAARADRTWSVSPGYNHLQAKKGDFRHFSFVWGRKLDWSNVINMQLAAHTLDFSETTVSLDDVRLYAEVEPVLLYLPVILK